MKYLIAGFAFLLLSACAEGTGIPPASSDTGSSSTGGNSTPNPDPYAELRAVGGCPCGTEPGADTRTTTTAPAKSTAASTKRCGRGTHRNKATGNCDPA